MYYWNSLSIYFPLLKYEFIKFNMLLWNIFDFFFLLLLKKRLLCVEKMLNWKIIEWVYIWTKWVWRVIKSTQKGFDIAEVHVLTLDALQQRDIPFIISVI